MKSSNIKVQEFQNKVDDKGIITKLENKNFYEVTLTNKGGLLMPVIIEWTYKDGTKEIEKIPAQVWRLNENKVIKSFIKDKEVASIKIDPMKETADINEKNKKYFTASLLASIVFIYSYSINVF